MTETNYAPAPAATKPRRLALAALIVGIAGFLIGWIPVLGFIAGGAAVALGTIALVKKQPLGLSLTGIILGALGALTSIAMTIGMALAPSIDTSEQALIPAEEVEEIADDLATEEPKVAPQKTKPAEKPKESTAPKETKKKEAPTKKEAKKEPAAPKSTPAQAEARWYEMHFVNDPIEFATREGGEMDIGNPLYAMQKSWGGSTDGYLEIKVQENLTKDSVKRLGINVLNFIGPEYPDIQGVVFTDASGRDYNFFRRDAPLAG